MTGLENCTKCKLRVLGETPVFPAGNVSEARLIIITRRATRECLIHGEAVMDPPGKQLRAAISEAGWSAREVYFTQLVKCAPGGPSASQTKCPTECRQTCSTTWLASELIDISCNTPIIISGRATFAEAINFLGEAFTARPLYMVDSESALAMGGRTAYGAAVEFFRSLKERHYAPVASGPVKKR